MIKHSFNESSSGNTNLFSRRVTVFLFLTKFSASSGGSLADIRCYADSRWLNNKTVR